MEEYPVWADIYDEVKISWGRTARVRRLRFGEVNEYRILKAGLLAARMGKSVREVKRALMKIITLVSDYLQRSGICLLRVKDMLKIMLATDALNGFNKAGTCLSGSTNQASAYKDKIAYDPDWVSEMLSQMAYHYHLNKSEVFDLYPEEIHYLLNAIPQRETERAAFLAEGYHAPEALGKRLKETGSRGGHEVSKEDYKKLREKYFKDSEKNVGGK